MHPRVEVELANFVVAFDHVCDDGVREVIDVAVACIEGMLGYGKSSCGFLVDANPCSIEGCPGSGDGGQVGNSRNSCGYRKVEPLVE